MILRLIRVLGDDEGTLGLGLLYHGAQQVCLIGELPWRGNRPNLSCIPPGRYRVAYLARSASGKYRDVYHVLDVPGRSGILIHAGNLTGDRERGLRTDSYGCLLPGRRVGRLGGQRAVLASRGAMQDLHAVTGRQGFTLEVIDHA